LIVVRSGALLTASEVEDFAAACRSSTHHVPIEKIVGVKFPRAWKSATKIWHNPIFEPEGHYGTDRSIRRKYRRDLDSVAEARHNGIKKSARKNWRAEISNAARVDGVKGFQVNANFDAQPRVGESFAQVGALLPRNSLEVQGVARRNLAPERRVRSRFD